MMVCCTVFDTVDAEAKTVFFSLAISGRRVSKKTLFDKHNFGGKKMAEAKKNMLTEEGYRKLEEELQDLKVNKRKEIAAKIKEAREQGDLSENAEYDAAKDEQRDNEHRIEEVEKILKNAVIVPADEGDKDVVHIGCTVKILDVEFNEELEYKIVGSTEADVLQGMISNESPVGVALMGSKAGETVEVETPSGELVKYKILEFYK